LGVGSEHQLEDALLDAAARVLLEVGYDGLTPEAVAAEAGLPASQGMPDRLELFAAVIRRDEDRFTAVMETAVAGAPDAGSQLVAVIETCVIDHDWSLWIELWSIARRDPKAAEVRAQLDEAFRDRIARLIEAGQSSGEFAVDDARPAALAIASLIDALAVEATLGDDTVSPNFMLGASASVAGRLVGAELKLRSNDG
jgi:AcrR family transcriptional regulator